MRSLLVLLLVGMPSLVVARCAPDAVAVGPLCVDRYEASAWQVPQSPSNAFLVKRIQKGRATVGDLLDAGAVQRGVGSADYAPACPTNGNGCTSVYAVSRRA
jgi:hypothetical protein